MRRIVASVVASLGASLLLASGILFGAGVTDLNAGLEREPASEWVAIAPVATPPALPTPTPTPIDPTAGSHDLNPFDAPPGTSAEDIANGKIWQEQQQIISDCLKEQGYDYPVRPAFAQTAEPPWTSTVPPEQEEAAFLALWGDSALGADYRWQDAGCHGYAVHVTGQDGNH